MPFEPCARVERPAAEQVGHVARSDLIARIAAEQIAREIEIAAVPGGAVEFGERELQFGVPRKDGLLAGAEVREEIFDHADARVEEFALAGGAVPGDARLQHVAEAVEFVPAAHVLVARGEILAGIVRVEIAAWLLRGGDIPDDGFGRCPEFGVGAALERESDGLDPLVHIGVREEGAAAGNVLPAGGAAEVVQDALLLKQLEQGGETHLDVHFAARGPEAAAQFDGGYGDAVQNGLRGVRRIEDGTRVLRGKRSEREKQDGKTESQRGTSMFQITQIERGGDRRVSC